MIVRAITVACVAFWLASAKGDAAGSCQRGVASFYGRWHHGKRTASGAPFDMNASTAASIRLPLGTMVLVTNLANGRSEVVRINDRGPYVRGRIIDLSQGTARRLGFEQAGLATVTVCVIRKAAAER
ncbi:Endolytic peptidoglycan transglycosylase RlpA (plasmid) [Rhodovastum atsumiense]|uniref:Endolytic peptidoglycan transglycosylase RlpA n=1 Tax=Rhodovastum atsumiense TaxID=504468 RepID=A0A5M6ITW9_9PROT|nr:septal ring lytic transglycosylase RlpA family protein [Rhodovastum atsumiense]KAA5611661.1 septal ring lytic transglycosylase RlpA family protein [Rhodovastum atsumiense]CAH2606238.1 Endolytic peptidoglycan transglycosylase RlpA [Rhodovastum atsumiense]